MIASQQKKPLNTNHVTALTPSQSFDTGEQKHAPQVEGKTVHLSVCTTTSPDLFYY